MNNTTESPKLHWVCANCATINAVAPDMLEQQPICPHCKERLIKPFPVVVNGQQLIRHIERNHLPVLVDFWAPWCGPCQAFAPTYEAFAQSVGGQLRVLKLDTESNQQTAQEFNIRSIPTIALFHHGREIGRINGALGLPQLQQWVVEQLNQ